MSEETVKVLVRCRPLNTREKNLNCECVVRMDPSSGLVQLSKPKSSDPPKSFTFDGSYYVDSNSKTIYEELGFPLVESVLQGYNGTVFAYGQTGCGKSFTMEGIPDPPEHRGVTPRSFEHIFQEVAVRENTKFLVRASYLEIYNEQIRDLLSPNSKHGLDLKEHPDKGVYVKDLSLNPVHTASDMIKLMAKGTQNRSVGATLMNADSSRSHSIFTVWVEMAETGADGEEHIRVGKLNLVDLAGSERQSKTGASGERFKEATKINLSLSALGNVISALVDGKAKHIPYRDSKLTRLLQDSLGGNTKTLMIACISPADNNYDETLSTLRYANRAKNIKNKASINEDPKDALLRQYQEEIQKLKAMLMGQSGVDMDAVMAFGGGIAPAAGGAPAAGSTARRSVAVDEAAIAERVRKEKEAERQAVERQLKEEYDQKLADLQEMYEQQKVSHTKLEAEFERLTAKLEQDISSAATAIEGSVDKEVKQQVKAEKKRLKSQQQADNTQSPQPHLSDVVVDDFDANGSQSLALDSTSTFVPKAVAVIGAASEPVTALLGRDGIPLEAGIDAATGQLVPVVDEATGQYKVVKGPSGELAKPIAGDGDTALDSSPNATPTPAPSANSSSAPPSTTASIAPQHTPVTVCGPDHKPRIVLRGPDGKLVEATLAADGVLRPVLSNSGRYIAALGPDGEAALPLVPSPQLQRAADARRASAPPGSLPGSPAAAKRVVRAKAVANKPVAVVDASGKLTTAVLSPSGIPVRAKVNRSGVLVPERDARTGKDVPVTGPDGAPAVVVGGPAAAQQRPLAVVGANGEAQVAVLGASGMPVEAVVDQTTGQLVPFKDARGREKPVLGPDGAPALPMMDTVIADEHSGAGGGPLVATPIAVAGPDGRAVAAIVVPNVGPVKARRDAATGQLVPSTDSKGNLEVVQGPQGQPARPVALPVQETPVTVITDKGEAVLAVLNAKGEAVEATVGKDGRLAAAKRGKAVRGRVLETAVAGAQQVEAARLEHAEAVKRGEPDSAAPATSTGIPVAMLNAQGKPIIAIMTSAGDAVEAEVNAAGQVVARVDVDGKHVPVEGKAVAAPAQQPTAVVMADGEVRLAMASPRTGKLVEAKVDAAGGLVPDEAAAPLPAEAKPAAVPVQDCKPKATVVAVAGPDNRPVLAVVDETGVAKKASVSADGQAVELLGDAEAVLGADHKPAKPIALPPMPQVVVTEDGVAAVAIRDSRGQLVQAEVAADGSLQAVCGADNKPQALSGRVVVVPELQEEVVVDTSAVAAAAAPVIAEPMVVVGKDGKPLVVMLDEQGQLRELEVSKDGSSLQPKRNKQGQLEPPVELEGTRPLPVSSSSMVTVVGPDGAPKAAVLDASGAPVEAKVDSEGRLVPRLGQDGMPKPLVNRSGQVVVPTLAPIKEESGHGSPAMPRRADGPPPPPPVVGSPTRTPSMESGAMVLQLQEKLRELEGNLVAGGDRAKDKKLKDSLEKKRKKAEQKQLARLRKAAERGDDDGILEEIYDNLQDEIKAKNRKLARFKDKLSEAQQEIADLNYEFEQEREDLLDTIRRQDMELKFAQAVLERTMPTLRRDCNYTNLDKIRNQAEWDDNSQSWLMPKLTVSGTRLPEGPGNGGRSSEDDVMRPPRGSQDDERYRPRFDSKDGEHFRPRRQRDLVGQVSQREREVAQQMDARLARFDNVRPMTSNRSQQLLQSNPLSSLERSPKNRRRRAPGGVSLGALAGKAANSPQPRRGFNGPDDF